MSNVIELNKELDTDKLDEIVSVIDGEIAIEMDSLQSSHILDSMLEEHQQSVQDIVENLDLYEMIPNNLTKDEIDYIRSKYAQKC